ncbi:putative uncharacterized protein DDB_G0282133 isoform X2 [Daktulosphaira vitifoliae]|nr:putative uncharacterized protein DDB_G0282133 isoform X2 [Daktulosphaira vitifoliae]
MEKQKSERAKKNKLQLLQKKKELEERKRRLDNLKDTTKKLAQASLKKKLINPKYISIQPEKNINQSFPMKNMNDYLQHEIIEPESHFSNIEHFKNLEELLNDKSFTISNKNFRKCHLVYEKQNSERRICAAKIIQQFYRKYKMKKHEIYKRTACNYISNFDLLDSNSMILNSNASCCSMKDLHQNQIFNLDSTSNKEENVLSDNNKSVFKCSEKVYNLNIKSTETHQNKIDFIPDHQSTIKKPTIIKSKFHRDLDNINCKNFSRKEYSNDYQNDQNFLVNEINHSMEGNLPSEPLIKFHNELKAELKVLNNLNNYLYNIEHLADNNLSKLEGSLKKNNKNDLLKNCVFENGKNHSENAYVGNTSSNLNSLMSTFLCANKALSGFSIHILEQLIRDDEHRVKQLHTILRLREKFLSDRLKWEVTMAELQMKYHKNCSYQEKQVHQLKHGSRIKKIENALFHIQHIGKVMDYMNQQRILLLEEQLQCLKMQISSKKLFRKIKNFSNEEIIPHMLSYDSTYKHNHGQFSKNYECEIRNMYLNKSIDEIELQKSLLSSTLHKKLYRDQCSSPIMINNGFKSTESQTDFCEFTQLDVNNKSAFSQNFLLSIENEMNESFKIPAKIDVREKQFFTKEIMSQTTMEEYFSDISNSSDQDELTVRINSLVKQLNDKISESKMLKKEGKKIKLENLKAKEQELLKYIDFYDKKIEKIKEKFDVEAEKKNTNITVYPSDSNTSISLTQLISNFNASNITNIIVGKDIDPTQLKNSNHVSMCLNHKEYKLCTRLSGQSKENSDTDALSIKSDGEIYKNDGSNSKVESQIDSSHQKLFIKCKDYNKSDCHQIIQQFNNTMKNNYTSNTDENKDKQACQKKKHLCTYINTNERNYKYESNQENNISGTCLNIDKNICPIKKCSYPRKCSKSKCKTIEYDRNDVHLLHINNDSIENKTLNLVENHKSRSNENNKLNESINILENDSCNKNLSSSYSLEDSKFIISNNFEHINNEEFNQNVNQSLDEKDRSEGDIIFEDKTFIEFNSNEYEAHDDTIHGKLQNVKISIIDNITKKILEKLLLDIKVELDKYKNKNVGDLDQLTDETPFLLTLKRDKEHQSFLSLSEQAAVISEHLFEHHFQYLISEMVNSYLINLNNTQLERLMFYLKWSSNMRKRLIPPDNFIIQFENGDVDHNELFKVFYQNHLEQQKNFDNYINATHCNDTNIILNQTHREAEKLKLEQIRIEKEIEYLCLAEKTQYFIRQIPNKPPPPYKSPNNMISTVLIDKQYSTKEIHNLINIVTNQLFENKDCSIPENFIDINDSKLHADYKLFIFDYCQEVTQRILNYNCKKLPVRMTIGKQINSCNSMIWNSKDLCNIIIKLMGKVIDIDDAEVKVNKFVAEQMYEESSKWTNFESDELELKNIVVQNLMKKLIYDTVKNMKFVFLAKYH